MTTNRWLILAVLFFARLTMAFQFQSVAALSPLIIDNFDVGLSEIGFLIGLYFAPGIFFALPGGAVAARFGDKRIVAVGLVLMLAGGVLIALTKDWNIFTAGRLIVGAGGVILNVVMTKMVVDWFASKELSTAMAIFINSWPVGVALALLILPILATTAGLWFARWALAGLVGAGLLFFALIYNAPEGVVAVTKTSERTTIPLVAVTLAGVVWALYNAALAMIFSFGPAFLTQEGYALTQAASLTSLFMVIFAIALPLGGIVADKTGRKDAIIYLSLLSFAALMPVAVFVPDSAFIVFCVLGALFAFGGGPTMTLPAEVLSPASRTTGMGIFFTIYYALMMIAPRIGGGVAESLDDAGAAILVGAGLSLAAAASLAAFRLQVRHQGPGG